MSEREELAEVIGAVLFANPGTTIRTKALAAADAILSRRPADDEGLVEMARKKISKRTGVHPRVAEEAARSALAVYHTYHDPLLREMREALEWYAGDGSTYDGIDVGQRARAVLRKSQP